MTMMLLTRDNYYYYIFSFNYYQNRITIVEISIEKKIFSMDTFMLTLHGLSFPNVFFFRYAKYSNA